MDLSAPAPERRDPQPAGELELLAPAGDLTAFEAAIDSGADAVYLGLTALNARHRARNFSPEELQRAVAAAHARGRKVYLTLNVDLAERELGLAARTLELARHAGVDAVLVRDPALLRLKSALPQLEFHFSTQTGVTSSSDVLAAKALGIARVVLARELSLPEIAAASAHGVETEVFAQGALCFSVSGRCLLSSWVGGRSGNRGFCTSPCRVPWTADGQPLGSPMSMRDLSVVHRLGELRATGARAIKIEGRLKTASWVRRAVSLYRAGLAGDRDPAALATEAESLGSYTGRTMTCGYLDADRASLTAETRGRGAEEAGASGVEGPSSPAAPQPALGNGDPSRLEAACTAPGPSPAAASGPDAPKAPPAPLGRNAYAFNLSIRERDLLCRCEFAGLSEEWTLPRSEVRRAHKAVPAKALLERLDAAPIDGLSPGRLLCNDPDYLLVPRAANAVETRVAAFLRRARRDRGEVRVELSAELRQGVAGETRSAANRHPLGPRADRARVEANRCLDFLARATPSAGVIIEAASAEQLPTLIAARERAPVVVALPQVFFEEDVAKVRALIEACREASVRVEINSWGGWWLAREAGVRFEAGPGLSVLNSLAARELLELGAECVTASLEADGEQLEELAAKCPAPLSLTVFGRPALMTTRVALPANSIEHRVLEDRRGVRLSAHRENGLWVFRPLDPFDLRRFRNDKIRVKHLVMDLVASPEPAREWESSPSETPLTFNYRRNLA